jgi:threonine aldolase
MIDLRSDTVTKPTQEMLQAMWSAEVGDDVFGEDPTVKALEQECADMFGMDGGLFCPSGTMTNQIALNILTEPYQEVICYEGAHIYKYEGGGLMGNSGLSVKLLEGHRGILSPEEVEAAIQPVDIHAAPSAVLAVENTVNRGGGSYYTLTQIKALHEVAQRHGLRYHMDGARVFNALVATGEDPRAYGAYFDTISVCLSKGLGAPVGSVLLFKKELAYKALRMRKVFGGGMRQAGYLAAAGRYALQHHVHRLQEDHLRAQTLAEILASLPFVKKVLPADTNILIFTLRDGLDPKLFLQTLQERGVRAIGFGARDIRMVTHLDFDDEALATTAQALRSLPF